MAVKQPVLPTGQQDGLVRRSRITSLLLKSPPPKCALIAAAPGFGKSMLLAEMADQLRAQGETAILLQLAGNAGTDELIGQLAATTGSGAPAERAAVAEALRRAGHVTILVDDYNRPSAVLDEQLTWLIQNTPANVRFVVSGRTEPALRLSRLQVRGEAIVATGEQMRFSFAETCDLMRSLLDRPSAASLHEHTGGWPLALGAAWSLLTQMGLQPSLSDMRARLMLPVSRFVSEEILPELDAAAQAVLLDGALFDGFDIPLLEAVTGARVSELVIGQLVSLGLLEGRTVGDRMSYDLVPILRDCLREIAMIADPIRTRAKWTAGSIVLEGRGNLMGAANCAALAMDRARAVSLAERSVPQRLLGGRGLSQVKSLLGHMPDVAAGDSLQLRMARVIVRLDAGDWILAQREIETLSGDLPQYLSGCTPLQSAEIIADFARLRLHVALAHDEHSLAQIAAIEADLHKAGGVLNDDASYMLGSSRLLCLQSDGDLTAAEAGIEALVPVARIGPTTGRRMYLNLYRGMVLSARGQLLEARRQYEAAAEIDPRRDATRKGAGSLAADVLAAEVRYAAGDAAAASEILDRHEGNASGVDEWFDIFLIRNVLQVAIDLERGLPDAALAGLALVGRTVRARGLSLREHIVRCLEIGVLASSGDRRRLLQADGAAAWREAAGSGDAPLPWRVRLLFGLCEARRLAAIGDVAAAVAVLDRLVREIPEQGMRIAGPDIGFVRSAILAEAGDMAGAQAASADAVALARSLGAVNSALGKIFGAAASGRAAIEETAAVPSVAAPAESQLRQILSDRDIEILRSLARGFPNKAIARDLGISENTVKQHLKRIYARIGVNNRVQAADRARVDRLVG